MENKWKISTYQYTLLVILCFLGTSVLVTSRSLALEAKQDAWISALVGIAVSLLVIWLYNALGSLFPNMTLTEYPEKLFGKWIGKIISVSFVSFLFLNAAMLLWFVGNFITTQMMPETPIQITNGFLVIVIVMSTRLGLETFARAAEILLPYAMAFLVILIIFLVKDIDPQNILPMFENGIKPILRGSLIFMSYSSLTLIVLMMIFPSCTNRPKDAKNGFLIGTIIGGFIIFIITVLSILVLGYDITARNVFPTYILAKKISLGEVLERVEVIIAMSWFITIFYKVLLYFYGTVLGLTQILELKDYRSLTFPLGILLVVFSLVVYPSSIYADTWNSTIWIPFSLSYGFLFPLLLLIVGKIQRHIRKGK